MYEAQELNGSEAVDLETPSLRELKSKSSSKDDCVTNEDCDSEKGEKCKKGKCVLTGKSRNVSRSRSKFTMMSLEIASHAHDLIIDTILATGTGRLPDSCEDDEDCNENFPGKPFRCRNNECELKKRYRKYVG